MDWLFQAKNIHLKKQQHWYTQFFFFFFFTMNCKILGKMSSAVRMKRWVWIGLERHRQRSVSRNSRNSSDFFSSPQVACDGGNTVEGQSNKWWIWTLWACQNVKPVKPSLLTKFSQNKKCSSWLQMKLKEKKSVANPSLPSLIPQLQLEMSPSLQQTALSMTRIGQLVKTYLPCELWYIISTMLYHFP